MTGTASTTSTASAFPTTAEVIARFNEAFRSRDVAALAAVVHDDCMMVSAQPAPDGTAYVGKEACVAFWAELMTDESTVFEVDHVFAGGPWATVRWRYRFGPTDRESVLGVNVTRVSEGRVIEQLGYTKTAGDVLPLPEDGTGDAGNHH
jgi:ketosteroid isomerase-like protein